MTRRTIIWATLLALLAALLPAAPAQARPAPVAPPRWVGEYTKPPGRLDNHWIAVGAGGSFAVSDRDNSAIHLYSRKGRLVRTVGGVGAAAPYNFSSPTGIATDSRNRFVIADTNRNRIVILDSGLRYVREFRNTAASVATTVDVATLSNDNIVVSYRNNSGAFMAIYSPTGQLLHRVDTSALNVVLPGALAVDGNDRIYSAQLDGVAVFSSQGAFIRLIPTQTTLADIVVDGQGQVHGVTAGGGTFIGKVYSQTGQLLLEYLPTGGGDGQALGATSMALDDGGRVIIADRQDDFDVLVFATCAGRLVTQAGTSGPDTIIGTRADDVILSGGGNDAIATGPGDDIICAGSGNDRVNVGSGNDIIAGQAGDDILLGKVGRDLINGGPGTDACGGGAGRDRAVTCETEVSIP